MSTGQMVAITGPAAVGKSTIAKGLQERLTQGGELWLLIELDVFARSLSREWISWGPHHGRFAERGYTYARQGGEGVTLRLGADGRRMLDAFHRSVAAVLRSGVNVICETIVYDEQDWNDWTATLNGLPVWWVSLTAPLDVLEGREEALRGPASQGLARGMVARKRVVTPDLELDSATIEASTIVQQICERLAKPQRPH